MTPARTAARIARAMTVAAAVFDRVRGGLRVSSGRPFDRLRANGSLRLRVRAFQGHAVTAVASVGAKETRGSSQA